MTTLTLAPNPEETLGNLVDDTNETRRAIIATKDETILILTTANDIARETTEAQRREINRLIGEVARLTTREMQNAKVVTDLQKELAYYKEIANDLSTAVVEIDGKAVTLAMVYEAGAYRDLCSVCRDVECGGCAVSDAEQRAEFMADQEEEQ